MKSVGLLLLGLAALPCAQASSITTTFASDNFGNPGWTNYFDATIFAPSLTVEEMDVNVNTTSAFSLEVYTRVGTYAGFELNGGAGWTLVSTGSGTGLGHDLASNVDLADFTLGPGLTGFAVRYITSGLFNYTDGNGSNQTVSNADLQLDFGSSADTAAAPFTGVTQFSSRVWNGTLYYSTAPVPEPASMAALGLGALALIAKRRKKA